jgi:hypothetical protein
MADTALLLHRCHCGRWASFGFGFRAIDGLAGTWFCSTHKVEGKDIVLEDKQLSNIPARFRGVCAFCNRDLDTREAGVHQWTAGWVMNRSGGGGHGISLPERDNRWAHRHCVERAVRSQTQQQGLFG